MVVNVITTVLPILGLLLIWGCIIGIIVKLLPQQYVEARRNRNEFTPLKWKVFRLLLYIVLTGLPPLVYRQLRALGMDIEILRAIASFSSALGFYFFTATLFSIFSYNSENYKKGDE